MQTALAIEDPTTSDLDGTNSSTNSYTDANRRFDIYTDTNVYGMQKGEDGSIALLIKLAPLLNSYGFTINGMVVGDTYEVYFTIGEYDFYMKFYVTRRAGQNRWGKCELYYRPTGGSWSSGSSISEQKISNGTLYTSVDDNIGFKIVASTTNNWGYVKFIAKKTYLYDLGARGSLVSNIYSRTLSYSTQMDRCPASGSVSWNLQGDIPDLPLGALLLALPLIALYAYLRRSRSGSTYGFKPNLQQLKTS